MRKNLLILIMLSVVLYSCGNSFGGFDPRSYNSKSALDADQPEEEGGDIDIPDDDPFKDHQDPNFSFDADKFKSWNFKVTDINKDNVPSYKFEIDKAWASLDTSKGEYSYSGGNIGSGVKEISRVIYYKYESKNPIFKADDLYNTGAHGERMERFYFYRFTGEATLDTKLDNYVIAVDTYTKLLFAYAVPTASYDPGFGYPNIPTAWGSVDKNVVGPADKKYQFYEYDPVGFVSENGDVTMYKWFYDILATDHYNPIIDVAHSAVASSMGAGKSPYLLLDIPFSDSVKGKTYSLRDTDDATIEDSLTLHSYKFSDDGKTITYSTETWLGKKDPTTVDLANYVNISASSATYDNKTFKLSGDKLYKNDIHVGTLGYDEPPLFSDRVKGKTFERTWKSSFGRTRKATFIFSPDGKTLAFKSDRWPASTGNGSYMFIPNSQAKNVPDNGAVYQLDGSVTLIGDDPWYGLVLGNNDAQINQLTGVGNGGGILWDGASSAEYAYLIE